MHAIARNSIHLNVVCHTGCCGYMHDVTMALCVKSVHQNKLNYVLLCHRCNLGFLRPHPLSLVDNSLAQHRGCSWCQHVLGSFYLARLQSKEGEHYEVLGDLLL